MRDSVHALVEGVQPLLNRQQLAQVLRAASSIVPDGRMLVIGSKAVLGSFDEQYLPREATAEIEVDLAYFDDPDEDKADRVDGVIGLFTDEGVEVVGASRAG